MRVLLGPPPSLPRLQSKGPSRDWAPTAELGTSCPRLGSAPLGVASGVWAGGRDAQEAVASGCGPGTSLPATRQTPSKPPTGGGLWGVAQEKDFCP